MGMVPPGANPSTEVDETLKRLATEVQRGASNPATGGLNDVFSTLSSLPKALNDAVQRDASQSAQNEEAKQIDALIGAHSPMAAFGGPELINAAKDLSGTARDNFTDRIKMLSLVQEAHGQPYIDQVEKYRNTLDDGDKTIFDKQYFGALQSDLKNLVASRNGPIITSNSPKYYTKDGKVVDKAVPGGEAHWADSPDAERLMRGFNKQLGVPDEITQFGPVQILSPQQEMTFGMQKQIDQLIKDGVINPPTGDIAHTAVALRRQGAEIAGNLMGKYIEDVAAKVPGGVPGSPFLINPLSLLPGTQQKDVADKANEATQSLVFEGTSGPSIASYFIPVLGPGERLGMAARIATNALIGGFSNAGVDVVSGDNDIKKLGSDFAIGAFGGATLPEVMWAFQKAHVSEVIAADGAKINKVTGYDKEATRQVLEDSGVATKSVQSDADGSIHVAGQPPAKDPSIPPRVPADNPFLTPGLEGSEELHTALVEADQVANDAHRNALALQREYRDQSRLRDSINRAKRGQSGPVPGEENLVDLADVVLATDRAAETNAALNAAQEAYRTKNIELSAAAISNRSADQAGKGLLDRTYRDILDFISQTGDSLTSSNHFVRAMGRLQSAVSGKVAGHIGYIISMSQAASHGLNRMVANDLDVLAKEIDAKLLPRLGDIFYKGPAEHAEAANATKAFTIIQHPDWWGGIDPDLAATMTKFQKWGNDRLKMVQELGYPIEAVDNEYLMQIWDNKAEHIDVARRGKVTIAKDREFPDYVIGWEQGLRPRNLTPGDLLRAHTKMMNQAAGDALQRKIVLAKYGKSGHGGPISNRVDFQSPLYRGYSAEPAVVAAVDSANKVQPWLVRDINEFGQRAKNTAFGLLDLAVFGVQIPHVAMFGSTRVLSGLAASFAERVLKNPESEFIQAIHTDGEFMTFAARAGLNLGDVATGLTPETGTLLSQIPIQGIKTLDEKSLGKWSKWLADLQFERAMTRLKLWGFKGELLMQHLAGNDITKPEVYTKAADVMNGIALTSRPAQSGLRRATEGIAATSANSVRAEISTILNASGALPLAKAVLKGNLRDPELIAGAASLANFAFMIYGVTSAANMAQGRQPVPFDPRNGNWGVLWIGDQKVSIVKERTYVRAVAKSWDALQKNDPSKLGAIWTQVVSGKASPLVSGAEAAAGYGFGAGGSFHTGDLSGKDRVLNMLPFSPLIEQLIRGENTSTPSLALNTLGFNNWDESRREQIDGYVREHNPYDINDPRYQDVVKFGIGGLEDRERLDVRQARPDLFTGDSLSADLKEAAKLTQEKFDRLHSLEIDIQTDPIKRRDYASARGDIVSDIASRRKGLEFNSQDQTEQAKAKTLYYSTIDEFRNAAPGQILKGEDFGAAEETARKRVLEKFGQAGLDAMDRALVVGTTKLDSEFLKARSQIEKSGYYTAPDALIQRLNAKDPNTWPFENYKDFLDANNDYAKSKGVAPTDTAAFKLINSQISKAKEQFRIAHPEIDALLSIWYGSKPLSKESKNLAAPVLGRANLEESSNAPDAKKKKTSTANLSPTTIERILNEMKH